MPWQSASSLVVVGAMFNAAAGLVGGLHYLQNGVCFFCFLVSFSISFLYSFLFFLYVIVLTCNFSSLKNSVSFWYFFCCDKKKQKSKELGMCANEWNYQLEKRDIIYNKIAKDIPKK